MITERNEACKAWKETRTKQLSVRMNNISKLCKYQYAITQSSR